MSDKWLSDVPTQYHQLFKDIDGVGQLWCGEDECKACSSHRAALISIITAHDTAVLKDKDAELARLREELCDEIQHIKDLIEKGGAHEKLTEAQCRLSSLKDRINVAFSVKE